MKKYIPLLILFYFLISLNLLAQNREEVYKKIKDHVKKLSQESVLSSGMVGFSLRDPSGKEVINFNSDKALIPASNLKVLTTATALKVLGGDFRFQTDLFYTGEIKDGVLNGDIIIRGSGDPTLGAGRIAGNPGYEDLLKTWVEKIKSKGVRKIEGQIMQDYSCRDKNIVPGGWIWEDMGNYYGAGISGLNFNENLYKITFRPGKKAGDSTEVISIEPEISGLIIENNVLTGEPGSGDNAWIFGSPYTNYRYMSGTIPAGVSEFTIKGSIPDPAFLTASLLTDALENEKIAVDKKSIPSGTFICRTNVSSGLIYSHYSPPVKDIIVPTNQKSINLYAEALYLATEEKLNPGSSDERSFLLNYWEDKGVTVMGNFILDGSGLSPRNAVKPSFISEVLSRMSKDSLSGTFTASLPVAGESGTLTRFCRGGAAEKRIIAKSGSMARVIGYSGYLKGKSGKLYPFCILVNNYEGKTSDMVKQIEKVANAMAELD